MKSFLVRLSLCLIFSLAVGFGFMRGVWEKLELLTYDWRLAIIPQTDTSAIPLAVIGITDQFQEKMGQKFSRRHHSEIIKILKKEKASIIGLDIYFPDLKDKDSDNELIKTIKESQSVVLPVFSQKTDKKGIVYKIPEGKLRGSLPPFNEAALSVGHINSLEDADHVIRKLPFFMKYRQKTFPHISLEMIRLYRNESEIRSIFPKGFLPPRKGFIPIDEQGAFYIHYIPPKRLNDYFYSFADVLNHKYPPDAFRNKVVLIGQTLLGAQNADLIPTPFGIQFGVWIQAASLWTFLSENYIYRLSKPLIIFLLLVSGIIFSFIFFSSRMYLNTFSFFAFSIVLVFVSLISFRKWGLFLDILPFLISGSICYVSSLGYSLKNAVRKIFQKETALQVLKGVEEEITAILKPSGLFPGTQEETSLGLEGENLIRETPEITLKTLTVSLGSSSGAFIISKGDTFKTIASTGNLLQKVNIEKIVRYLEEKKMPLIIHRYSEKEGFAHSSEIKNIMAFPLLSESVWKIFGIFINKTPTVFSESSFFTLDDLHLAETLSLQALIAIQNSRLNLALKDAQLETIFRLAVAIEYRDRETGSHIHRMSDYAAVIAKNFGLPQAEVELIKNAMPMHDIGKIAIPDHVLLKPGKLTEEEREIIKNHSIIGSKMLKGSSSLILQAAEIIALSHQERYDGSGYPYGLKGNNIPIYGRIAALADIFDAVSSKRIYKEAVDLEGSFKIIEEESKNTLDPKTVKFFLEGRKEIEKIYFLYKEEEEKEIIPFSL